MTRLREIFKEVIDSRDVLLNENLDKNIGKVIEVFLNALRNGNKILVAGNDGSTSDDQHFVRELVGRFLEERRDLPTIAISTNTFIYIIKMQVLNILDPVFAFYLSNLYKKLWARGDPCPL